MDLLVLPEDEGWFILEDVDLTGVKTAVLTATWHSPPSAGIDFEVRLNSPDGKLLGSGSMPAPVEGQPGGQVSIKFESVEAERAEKLFFIYKPREGESRVTTPL